MKPPLLAQVTAAMPDLARSRRAFWARTWIIGSASWGASCVLWYFLAYRNYEPDAQNAFALLITPPAGLIALLTWLVIGTELSPRSKFRRGWRGSTLSVVAPMLPLLELAEPYAWLFIVPAFPFLLAGVVLFFSPLSFATIGVGALLPEALRPIAVFGVPWIAATGASIAWVIYRPNLGRAIVLARQSKRFSLKPRRDKNRPRP